VTETAASLRADFDRAFADAPAPRADRAGDLLAIRLGGDPYALHLAEIASLHADPVIVPVPSPVAELRGLAGLRNNLLPVYDLRALLGYGTEGAPRWLVIARPLAGGAAGPVTAVGLAFDHLDGHRRADRTLAASGTAAERQHVRGAVSIDGALRPVIDIPSVLDAITRRARALAPREEP
jgi:chemotaxis signal transduction protein